MSDARFVELRYCAAHEFEATEEKVAEFAAYLGVDLEFERDLFPIARAGLVADLPEHWVPCRIDGTEDFFFFNKATGESLWDHPLDDLHRRLLVEARAKRRCFVVTLALLKDGAESRIRATGLAGDVLCEQAVALDECFGVVEDKLRGAIRVDGERVLCFALPNAQRLGFSSRARRTRDVFEQE